MRRLVWIGLAAALAAPSVWAGAPQRGGGGMRGMGMFGPGARGPREQTDLFDSVRRYMTLTEEQQAAIGKLDDQRDAEQRAALAEINKRLDTKFLALVLEALPAEEKAKFEKAWAAIAERDAAVAAADKELRDALSALRTAQGVVQTGMLTDLPGGKADIIRRYLKLTDEQHRQIDEAGRNGGTQMRDAMRDIPRPQDFTDVAARRAFGEAVRKAREQVDNQSADAMAGHLTDDQQKAYRTAAAAYDAAQKKIQDAEQACLKKLTDLVGAEKANARPGFRRGGQGAPQPAGGAPPKAGF